MIYLVFTKDGKEVESVDVSQMEMNEIIEKGAAWTRESDGYDFLLSPSSGNDETDRKKLGQQISNMRSLRMHGYFSPRAKKK